MFNRDQNFKVASHEMIIF